MNIHSSQHPTELSPELFVDSQSNPETNECYNECMPKCLTSNYTAEPYGYNQNATGTETGT